jgi:hypothetical protein
MGAARRPSAAPGSKPSSAHILTVLLGGDAFPADPDSWCPRFTTHKSVLSLVRRIAAGDQRPLPPDFRTAVSRWRPPRHRSIR